MILFTTLILNDDYSIISNIIIRYYNITIKYEIALIDTMSTRRKV